MTEPRVINIDIEPAPEGSVYIGRPSKWGNPFKVGKDGTLDDVIIKYIDYIKKNHQLIAEAKQELKGKSLACHCKPSVCHADLLLAISNNESFDINDEDSIFNLIKQGDNNGI